MRFPKEERCAESPPTIICGKRRENRTKPVKMKILSSGVVFTLEEGIAPLTFVSKDNSLFFRIVEIVLP